MKTRKLTIIVSVVHDKAELQFRWSLTTLLHSFLKFIDGDSTVIISVEKVECSFIFWKCDVKELNLLRKRKTIPSILFLQFVAVT
uniref:Uncharacterized protein n=1 Tax=Caenorhabditis japonica TaxID=281687 RepID=A0A8R1EM38_CAEJA